MSFSICIHTLFSISFVSLFMKAICDERVVKAMHTTTTPIELDFVKSENGKKTMHFYYHST